MDPEHMKWMATQVQNGDYLFCPTGSHCSMWDDQTHYFPGLINFVNQVNKKNFRAINANR
jgi:proline iminopeptidase